ncbi:hypothetical protein BZG02_14255 [Labilibaculum filiforme]|uniref:Uncharacterized protein n=1 Tax=Labilibaculum filiforme TaxID=1940526 RepID=A0A2N3HVK8_9BACT|nr:hypothetical protein [Labilibaculum filiforme]PKQ62089.1 hypothetical protein BZG02_14255 [Labilibaculum filiforme]
MKRIIAVLLLNFLIISTYSQEYGKYKIEKNFNSVFKNLEKGKFAGTINGVLFIKDTKDKEVILDFQAGKAILNIVHDSTEMYDVSTKEYIGWTTSGKTKIYYSTYSSANKLSIELSSGIFKIGSHDGASDMVVNGINYHYKSELHTEYLVLTIEKDLVLDNFWWLRHQGILPKKAYELKKEIVIQANSVIIFAMN